MKRFRKPDGTLAMPVKAIAEATLEEARAYYIEGEKYITESNVFVCHYSGEQVQFSSKDGHNLFIPVQALGMFLPDVASRGLEITKLIDRQREVINTLAKLLEFQEEKHEAV